MLSRKPPLSHVDALGELESVVKDLEFSPKIQQLWLRAAASRPNDEKLHKMWFWAKTTISYFGDAQQVLKPLIKLQEFVDSKLQPGSLSVEKKFSGATASPLPLHPCHPLGVAAAGGEWHKQAGTAKFGLSKFEKIN